ncbi:MAG: DUF3494 domain-containing protein [Bacteroidetes bacterium]|nr:MAG: DUF3494 domain-containing protein [Bacteroidota bacterium]
MQINKIWTISIAAFLILAGGCKKDKFTEITGVCPLVTSTNPTDLATNVPNTQIITASFNEAMKSESINSSSFTISGSSQISGTISYDETNATASFAPNVKLAPNTTYTAKISASVRDLMGSALQADYVWSFSTGDSLMPMVIATDPANNAVGVPLNKTITATFNMPMDSSTIDDTTFIVRNGATAIAGSVSYNGVTASFKPISQLAANTVYTATITNSAKNKAGTAMAANHVWTFTTGTTVAPTVTSTDPADNATGVFINKVIQANFSMPMDAATVNNATFMLKQGANPITGTVTYNGTTASFTPSVNLALGGTYTATITTGTKNPSGTPLANEYEWTFTTGNVVAPIVNSTDPANNATGVTVNKTISATFNMAMDALTINSTTFTLKQGTTNIAGLVSYSGSTATFNPTSNLSSGSTYTATITTGAKNTTGTPLANDYVWSFTTQNPAGPGVVNLKSVEPFGIMAGVGVSNNAGFSIINDMDVGISPGIRSSVTGFPPGIVVNGAIYASDDANPPGIAATLTQAKQDLTDAYLFAEGATTPAPAIVSGDIGGTTLAPGIYKSTSTLLIQSGDLTLDAQGDPNATWIFQVASGFTTVGGAGGNVILTGGAQAKNIFWQTGSSATIGDFTVFQGTILALTSIAMNSGATANGRMLVQNGSVVLTNTNIINKP